MRRLLTSVLLCAAFCCKGQVTTITTGTVSTAYYPNLALSGATFIIANNNPYPIKLKSLDNLVYDSLDNSTFYLRYSSTSLSGAPTNAAAWTLITSATVGTFPTMAIYPIFSNINFIIPANTTYRFLLYNSTGYFIYGPNTTTPNSFTAGGVTLGRGNYQINGLNVGYAGGTPNYNTYVSRFWCGTITFEPAIVDNMSASQLLTPANNAQICSDVPVPIQAIIENKGSAMQHNFPVGAVYTGPGAPTPTVLSMVYTDTLLSGMKDTITLGTITPSAGAYSVYAYTNLMADSLTSDDTSATRNFTVLQPVLPPIVASDTVCLGDTAVLSISSANPNVQFNWFTAASGGSSFSTGTSVTVPGVVQDTVLYVSVKENNCESPRIPIYGVLGAPPVVDLGDDTSFCSSIPLILDAANPGAAYLWSTGDTLQTISVTNQTGAYWVIVDKYCASSDTINVTIRPSPSVSGISWIRSNNFYQFSASGAKNVETYFWEFGDGTTSTDSTPVHVYDRSVTVALIVKLTVGNACGIDTAFKPVPTDVADIDENAFRLYPNPAGQMLYIESPQAQLQKISIMDVMGRTVLHQNVTGTNIRLDISSLSPGNYIVQLQTRSGIASKPLQIHR